MLPKFAVTLVHGCALKWASSRDSSTVHPLYPDGRQYHAVLLARFESCVSHFARVLATEVLSRSEMLSAGCCSRVQEAPHHSSPHTAGADQPECSRGDQAQVHRHLFQVRPWPFPDCSRESPHHGPHCSCCEGVMAVIAEDYGCWVSLWITAY